MFLLVLFCLFCIHSLSQAKYTPCTQDGIYFVKDGEENYHSTKGQEKDSCQGEISFESFNSFNSFIYTSNLERCQNETKCTFWVYHKPLKICYLQSGTAFEYKDEEYISGYKYCNCYVKDINYDTYSGKQHFSKQKTIEDCRYAFQI